MRTASLFLSTVATVATLLTVSLAISLASSPAGIAAIV